MSLLGRPRIAAAVARTMQLTITATARTVTRHNAAVFTDMPSNTRLLTIPTSIAPAPAVVYLPASTDTRPAVHLNFHGGGYVLRGAAFDDALCRYLAAEAGIVVLNVDYAVAPQHPFPDAPQQAFEVAQWVVEHAEEQGWDGGRLTVGGQSAGGGLAAAVARLALEQGAPPIALQVLHYPPLDLTTRGQDKPTVIAKPMITPWMIEVFNSAYVPNPDDRADRLASPAGPADTADLTGIAPALVITPELDRLHAEGHRYAERLRTAGALVRLYDVPQADHAYDTKELDKARVTYALIAHCITQATPPSAPFAD